MRLLTAISIGALLCVTIVAQTTGFNYQGRLTDNTLPANGNYSMKFRLYDADTLGGQIGSEISLPVSVVNGLFAVRLDFGASSFPANADRWLEVEVGTTILTPRQQLASSPFAIRSIDSNNADQLSGVCDPCVTNGQIVSISGTKVTGSVSQADNAATANTATTATNSLNLGGVAANNYLQTSGGTITGNLMVGGVLSGNGSGLTNLPTSSFPWEVVAGTAVQAQSNRGYILGSYDSPITLTLPASPVVGDVIRVAGAFGYNWRISQNAGQYVVGDYSTRTVPNSWTPHESNRSWAGVATSADGTKLVAIVGNGQIYTSTDSGVTWTPRDSNRGWWGVASSADGTKLVAVVNGGQIYTSTDSGVTWTPRDSNRSWFAVASSADGTKLVAGTFIGRLYTSTDSGVTWTPRESNRGWYSIASSADGTKLVAADQNSGQIYTSTDSGVTWTPRESIRNWYGVASSADGSKLVAVVQGGQIYTSTDFGVTWTPRESNRLWNGVASSADGTRLVAVVIGGQIYSSEDSGVTWIPRETNKSWYGVASSADGTKLVAVVIGGQIYTTTAGRSFINGRTTTIGVNGYLVGDTDSAVELLYVGNGKFLVLSSSGPLTAN